MMRRETLHPRRERWERENAAPRLKQLLPELKSLRLSLEETRGGHAIPGTRRVQHVLVDTASAHFEVPCGEARCTGGGHDLTRIAASKLRDKQASFSGTSECNGSVGERACDRHLAYAFSATFGPPDLGPPDLGHLDPASSGPAAGRPSTTSDAARRLPRR